MKFFAVLAAIVTVGAAFSGAQWNLQQLSAALADPHTDPALIPYLEAALNDLYAAIHSGQEIDSIVVPIPAIVPEPAAPEVHPEPAAPLPSSPLVQVIVNVNKQMQQITDVPVPEEPAVIPSPGDDFQPIPIDITDITPVMPTPVDPGFNPLDIIAINPDTIGVLEVSPAGDSDIRV